MFKRISIILLILCTLLVFTIGAGATAAGLFVKKDAANTYIDYVDADGTSIMKIDDTDGVTIAVEVVGNTYTSMTITGTADASSLTAGSVVTAGGIACAKQLYLGDDIDMSTNTTGVYDITLKDGQADGLSIVAGSTDMVVFTTATDAILITPPLTVTGLVTLNGGLTLGADGAGFDVIFYGDNSGSDFFWNQDGDTDASLTLGTTGGTKGVDFTVYGEANGTYLMWDRSVDDLLLAGTVTRLILSGTVDTSLTDASIVTAGGVAVTKQLWLGDDIDMSTSGTGVYEITLKDTVDDALSILGGSTDMMLFDTDTDQITFTPEILLKDDIDLSTNSTGVYDLTLKTNQADALSITDGTDIIVFCTTTGTPTVTITPATTITGALSVSGGIAVGATTTGIGFTAGTVTDGIVFSSTVTDEVIQIGGVYDHGIRFTEDPVAGDVTNSFINVGDYTTGIAVAPTSANMFGVMHNVTIAVNVAYWYQAYYTKITTSGTTTNTSIAGHALRMNVASSLEAVYGIQCHTNITAAADVTQELISVSTMVDMGTGDTTTDRVLAFQAMITGSGTAGTVTGLLQVASFVNAGTVVDTDAIIFVSNQTAATSAVALEFDLDGTVTNAFEFNGTVCDGWTSGDSTGADWDAQDEYVLIPVKVEGITPQLYILAAETYN